MRFHAYKTVFKALSPVVFLIDLPTQGDSSAAVLLCVCVSGIIYDVSSIIICSSPLLLLAPRECFASCLWHFLGIFIYIYAVLILMIRFTVKATIMNAYTLLILHLRYSYQMN